MLRGLFKPFLGCPRCYRGTAVEHTALDEDADDDGLRYGEPPVVFLC